MKILPAEAFNNIKDAPLYSLFFVLDLQYIYIHFKTLSQ